MNIQNVDIGDIVAGKTIREIDKETVANLAKSIKAVGLKQNLVGYMDDKGTCHITAGNHRLAALKKIKWQGPVPVRIEPKEEAVNTALTENAVRKNMRLVEEVLAFKMLHAEGKTQKDIMACYDVTASYYEKIMALIGLPDDILEAWLANDIDYDHAKEFATAGHDLALKVFNEIKEKGKFFYRDGYDPNGVSVSRLHALLFGDRPSQLDAVIRYVTNNEDAMKAYLKAGGAVTTDLFQNETYLEDGALAEEIVGMALTSKAQALTEEQGWQWTEVVAGTLKWEKISSYPKRFYPQKIYSITDEQKAEYDYLSNLEQHTDEQDQRYTELEEIASQYEEQFDPEITKVAGILVGLDYGGEVTVIPVVRKDDIAKAREMMPEQIPEITKAGKDDSGYSATLVTQLNQIKRAAIHCDLIDGNEDRIVQLANEYLNADPFSLTRFNLSNIPDTLPNGAAELGLHPPKEVEEAYKGQLKRGRNAASRLRALLVEIAIRLDTCEFEPNIRKWWTPNERFFDKLKKPQLIEVLTDIGAPKPQAGSGLTAWEERKKGQLVEQVALYFSGEPKAEARSQNGELHAEAVTAIEAAKTWLPPCLRTAEEDDMPTMSEEEEAVESAAMEEAERLESEAAA